MDTARTFTVTMVRPGRMPLIEVAAYEYVGSSLPLVGETILMRRLLGSQAGETTRGYVTRVNPAAETPIAVTEVAGEPSPSDDLIA